MSPFKAYDIRGRVGAELTCDLMMRVGYAFATCVARDGQVVIGRDCRESSPELADALSLGVRRAGLDVCDLGLCGTEEVYFATDHFGAAGGLMVTASHNPMGDNGLKLVRAGARPLSRDAGLAEIEALATDPGFAMPDAGPMGQRRHVDPRAAYVERVLSFVDPHALPPMHILVNAGHGAAGPTFDAITDALGAAGSMLRFTREAHAPDPGFPKGVPNPLLPGNHPKTAAPLLVAGADMGVAWDGDFDRCFFFDDQGRFVDGVYLVGLLAEALLRSEPGAPIVYDPRSVLNTEDILARRGARPVMARTGHSLMKAAMRESNALYGGEMSAHHYFRDFMFCDSGMIPWLLVAAHIGASDASLAELVSARITDFPVSGEINFQVRDTGGAIARVVAAFEADAQHRDDSDGVSLRLEGWRFNLRCSNTEPLLRLNVEAERDAALVAERVAEISALIEAYGVSTST